MTRNDNAQYTELIADVGKHLTQVSVENEEDRIFATRLSTPNPEQWEEWSDTVMNDWNEQHQEEIEQ